MMALVVAIAGMMLPAMAAKKKREADVYLNAEATIVSLQPQYRRDPGATYT